MTVAASLYRETDILQVQLTYDLATTIRDSLEVQKALAESGVMIRIHFLLGPVLDNVPELLEVGKSSVRENGDDSSCG